MRRKGRPYPKDPERRRRVRIELAKRDMTTIALARELQLCPSHLFEIISGTRISPKTEAKIAAYFGLPAEALFPRKPRGELDRARGDAV
jgi:plasmid maintenance system antidote protein VapI